MMHVICIHVIMVEHVTVRVMVATIVIVQPDIPVVNVKHYSPPMTSAPTPTHASMVVRVWHHHGVPIPIRVSVRGVIRGFGVRRVSTPPLVVPPLPVIMVAVVYHWSLPLGALYLSARVRVVSLENNANFVK